MKTIQLATILVASCAIACSSSSSGSSGDGGVPADSSFEDVASKCGHPGDMGNSLGVGKFCEHIADCADTKSAHLCSVIGDLTTHFCLMTCTPPADAGDAAAPAAQCGENATCECGNGGCGCTPNACLGP